MEKDLEYNGRGLFQGIIPTLDLNDWGIPQIISVTIVVGLF
jgi:hypothetical protein